MDVSLVSKYSQKKEWCCHYSNTCKKIACAFIYTGIHADLRNLITPTKQNEIFGSWPSCYRVISTNNNKGKTLHSNCCTCACLDGMGYLAIFTVMKGF